MHKPVCALLFLTMVAACSGSDREQEMLKQAADIHNEMMKKAGTLEAWLNEVSATLQQAVPADSISDWKRSLASWKEEVVEVPGNEEHDDHEAGHHHHDSQNVELTADQMLKVQQELDSRLATLIERVKPYQ